jgi:hypothetical protein
MLQSTWRSGTLAANDDYLWLASLGFGRLRTFISFLDLLVFKMSATSHVRHVITSYCEISSFVGFAEELLSVCSVAVKLGLARQNWDLRVLSSPTVTFHVLKRDY